jgi:nucleoside-diphosphate-sugar epimerase
MATETTSGFHLIFGTGPAACWTARDLCAKGFTVKAVNRSGMRPALMPADVTVIRADVSDLQQTIEITQGASVVYQALGPAYSRWAELFPLLQANTIEAAIQARARYVALENLYMLDTSLHMTEHSLEAPRSAKGRVRQQMHHDLMQRHARGDLQVCALRASDYYGPGVTMSALGERVFGNLVKGKAAQVMVRASCPHSFAYIGDVGRALAVLGTADTDAATWGRTWLAPHDRAQSQHALVAQACELLGMPTKLSVVRPWMLRLVGLLDADARAYLEMLYQYEHVFVVDSSLSERTLGLQPTEATHGLAATIDWYRELAKNAGA